MYFNLPISPTQSIGMLSYTFLRSTGKEDIVVPMVSFCFLHNFLYLSGCYFVFVYCNGMHLVCNSSSLMFLHDAYLLVSLFTDVVN